MPEDLWGEIEPKIIKTPISILREQSVVLEEKTKGLLTGAISTSQAGDANNRDFNYSYSLYAVSLNYHYTLFSITHKIGLYPVYFTAAKEILPDGQSGEADNEKEFLDVLRKIFQSPHTRSIISALISQIEA